MPLDPRMQQQLLMQQMFQNPNGGPGLNIPAGQGGVGQDGLQIGPGMLPPDDAATGVGPGAMGGVNPPPMNMPPQGGGAVPGGPYSGPPASDIFVPGGPYSGPPPSQLFGPGPMAESPIANRRQFDDGRSLPPGAAGDGDIERRRRLIEAIMAAARSRGMM